MRTLPLAVWRLMLAYSLMMAGVSVLVLIAGIIGTKIAPSEGLATLPLALGVIGVASSTLPTGRLLQRFGRRPVFIGYALIAIAASFLASFSLVRDSYPGLCMAAFLIGWAGAASHQYRFAALELVPPEMAPKATSVLMLGGILSAFIGPELAVRGRGLLQTDYAGSFLLLALAYLAGMIIVSFYRDKSTLEAKDTGAGRPLAQIMRTPNVILAITAAALGYGIMSFIMTATPISMHVHSGHSLESTKLVIQSHIAAMYLPSLVYAWFFSKLGFRGMFWAGSVIYLLCLAIALINTQFIHFWLALVMVGVGWNFLFLSGTNLLPLGYLHNERFRVQAANDFLVFSIQALASLSSGWVLYVWKWDGVLWACVPLVLAFFILLSLSKAPVERDRHAKN